MKYAADATRLGYQSVMCLASHERPLERNELARARAAARLGFPERQVRVARLGSLAGPPAARSARSEPGAPSQFCL